MKRVTLLVEDIDPIPDGEGDLDVTWPEKMRGTRPQWLPSDAVVLIEEVPDPLPCEVGERFWGARGNDDPQWWYVIMNGDGRIFYAPTDMSLGWCDPIRDDEAEDLGLSRAKP